MKEKFLKTTRTIVGMPFVLIGWPIGTICTLGLVIITHGVCIVRWVFSGSYMPKYSFEIEEVRNMESAFVFSLLLPYQFIKKIWGKV